MLLNMCQYSGVDATSENVTSSLLQTALSVQVQRHRRNIYCFKILKAQSVWIGAGLSRYFHSTSQIEWKIRSQIHKFHFGLMQWLLRGHREIGVLSHDSFDKQQVTAIFWSSTRVNSTDMRVNTSSVLEPEKWCSAYTVHTHLLVYEDIDF